ncbi:outer membrane beta-barrel protein [Hymenobacter sp. IS2118]|uniref:outer membrane beta-barrel protein n=1 Tax=Hymenobacter sp. IS2118 TaxID=1505605 RepID=UPI00054FE795|nr:outer membrane beta-barrel protein [Hymenobacter sp. IS2118]
MQKIFLLALFSAGTGLAQAQSISAGTVSLGGSIGYSRQTDSQDLGMGQVDVTNSRFQIAPAVGYFVADNLAIGLNLGYSASRLTFSQSSSNDLDAATSFQVGPYVQYYKMLSEQFGVLGTLGAGYTRNSAPQFTGPNTTVEVKSSGFYSNLTPGVIFFPVPKFGINASIGFLGYDQTRLEDSATDRKFSSFGANFGLNQLNFGGTYFFGR